MSDIGGTGSLDLEVAAEEELIGVIELAYAVSLGEVVADDVGGLEVENIIRLVDTGREGVCISVDIAFSIVNLIGNCLKDLGIVSNICLTVEDVLLTGIETDKENYLVADLIGLGILAVGGNGQNVIRSRNWHSKYYGKNKYHYHR